ncbi:hypothetical protein PMAYCL1PPCAC_09499, partial [Pristionchus mayeri]
DVWTPTPEFHKLTNHWWRVDVYKHDNNHMSVFFQGFWADVRQFPRSLNDVRFVSLTSDFVDTDLVDIFVKTPSTNMAIKSAIDRDTIVDYLMTNHADSEDNNVLVGLKAFPLSM